MTERKYLPTFADLVDRLSIVLLKQIFIPENREGYVEERDLIEHDLNEMLTEGRFLTGENITAILMIMLTNHTIWRNESEARKGGRKQDKLLKFTHSINGCRNMAKNIIARGVDRMDFKVDCYAADLPESFGNWDIWKDD